MRERKLNDMLMVRVSPGLKKRLVKVTENDLAVPSKIIRLLIEEYVVAMEHFRKGEVSNG